ncbi:unnamed protein product [Amoebophrya sp. A25]|nr:unnamed protein product [Amoebophrya sp. A25]|eukprot:GSA25T00004066001.1
MMKSDDANTSSSASPLFYIDTVDGFQGNEREVVLLALTRTEDAGFLRDSRRVNVALTRARRGLIVFGSSKLLRGENLQGAAAKSRIRMWTEWLSFINANGAVYSINEAEQMAYAARVLNLHESTQQEFDHNPSQNQRASKNLKLEMEKERTNAVLLVQEIQQRHESSRVQPTAFENVHDPTMDGGRERARVLGDVVSPMTGAQLRPLTRAEWREVKVFLVDSGNVLHFGVNNDLSPRTPTPSSSAGAKDLSPEFLDMLDFAIRQKNPDPNVIITMPIVPKKYNRIIHACSEQIKSRWKMLSLDTDIDKALLELASSHLRKKPAREICIISNDKFLQEATDSAFRHLPLAELRVGYQVDEASGALLLADKKTLDTPDGGSRRGAGLIEDGQRLLKRALRDYETYTTHQQELQHNGGSFEARGIHNLTAHLTKHAVLLEGSGMELIPKYSVIVDIREVNRSRGNYKSVIYVGKILGAGGDEEVEYSADDVFSRSELEALWATGGEEMEI